MLQVSGAIEPVGNQLGQSRIPIGNLLQLLFAVGNEPAALPASKRDVKRTAIGVVFFVAKDLASPYVLTEAPGTNGSGEDVEA